MPRGILGEIDSKYAGDVVVFVANDWEGRRIRDFTKSPYVHCALRTGENSVVSLRFSWVELFKKAAGIRFFQNPNLERLIKTFDLDNLPNYYEEYIILRHKDMTSEKREKIKEACEKIKLKDYDLRLFARMAYKHWKKINPDATDLSTPLSYLCSNIASGLWKHHANLDVIPGVDWSQIEPQHYSQSPYVVREKRKKREGMSWIDIPTEALNTI